MLWAFPASRIFSQTFQRGAEFVQANVQLKDVPEAKMVLEKYNLMTLGKMQRGQHRLGPGLKK